jgi:hypothetical protein
MAAITPRGPKKRVAQGFPERLHWRQANYGGFRVGFKTPSNDPRAAHCAQR